jgi:hypothetical protein
LPLLLPCFYPEPQQTSSRPKAALFAAAAERSLYFAFALAVVVAVVRFTSSF